MPQQRVICLTHHGKTLFWAEPSAAPVASCCTGVPPPQLGDADMIVIVKTPRQSAWLRTILEPYRRNIHEVSARAVDAMLEPPPKPSAWPSIGRRCSTHARATARELRGNFERFSNSDDFVKLSQL